MNIFKIWRWRWRISESWLSQTPIPKPYHGEIALLHAGFPATGTKLLQILLKFGAFWEMPPRTGYNGILVWKAHSAQLTLCWMLNIVMDMSTMSYLKTFRIVPIVDIIQQVHLASKDIGLLNWIILSLTPPHEPEMARPNRVTLSTSGYTAPASYSQRTWYPMSEPGVTKLWQHRACWDFFRPKSRQGVPHTSGKNQPRSHKHWVQIWSHTSTESSSLFRGIHSPATRVEFDLQGCKGLLEMCIFLRSRNWPLHDKIRVFHLWSLNSWMSLYALNPLLLILLHLSCVSYPLSPYGCGIQLSALGFADFHLSVWTSSTRGGSCSLHCLSILQGIVGCKSYQSPEPARFDAIVDISKPTCSNTRPTISTNFHKKFTDGISERKQLHLQYELISHRTPKWQT